MEKKKSRCMALDCCCYFIPASALLFGFYQQVGCCWGENRFFDRDDAQIIPQYENLAKACAERHLMVDFHGCSKPTGLHRAYPNILSYEAIRCAECFKWDTTSNPDYQLQCIFARMLGGGIDYTPGSMRNSTLEKFKPIDPGLPSSLGTRSHELALFVVLSAPFASLCDSPDEYRKYPDYFKIFSGSSDFMGSDDSLSCLCGRICCVG